MDVQQQIEAYISGQSEAKRRDMEAIDRIVLRAMPKCRLWFLDGKDESGKTVSNPSVGYGLRLIQYADGKTKEFYQVGMSANSTGISVYILGIDHKTYLSTTYGSSIGKASVTGYCIKFKALKDIDSAVLEAAIRDGAARTS